MFRTWSHRSGGRAPSSQGRWSALRSRAKDVSSGVRQAAARTPWCVPGLFASGATGAPGPPVSRSWPPSAGPPSPPAPPGCGGPGGDHEVARAAVPGGVAAGEADPAARSRCSRARASRESFCMRASLAAGPGPPPGPDGVHHHRRWLVPVASPQKVAHPHGVKAVVADVDMRQSLRLVFCCSQKVSEARQRRTARRQHVERGHDRYERRRRTPSGSPGREGSHRVPQAPERKVVPRSRIRDPSTARPF